MVGGGEILSSGETTQDDPKSMRLCIRRSTINQIPTSIY